MPKPRLVPLDEMDRLPGLNVPNQFYTVLHSPARLAGMVRPPDDTPWAAMAAYGFRHVVCLTTDSPSYDPAPLRLLHAASLEDLYGERIPRDPHSEAKRIRNAAIAVLESLEHGEATVVHCVGGTGRTGTVIAVVLRFLGVTAGDVQSYLDVVHRARGGRWPESPWQAEVVATIAG